ncbi:MAG: AAA family ATPase [Erysipelotrichaceae bacterium]|nr:AAA family ATPase [Erysipelotrichaceae bacterium]
MTNKILETLDGSFVYTIYKTPSYMVTKFETDKEVITVTGPSFDFIKGEKYTISGEYVDHPKYGFQFNMLSVSKYIPNHKDEIIKFLSSASFKGVGKKAAEKIYNAFGDEVLRIIKNDITVLNSLDLTAKQVASIKSGIETIGDDDSAVIFLLITAGFTNSEAARINSYYKEATPFIVKDNPYRIYLDVYGISFAKVVNCAKGMTFEDKEHKFKEAYLIYIFKEVSFKLGNTYLDKEDFSAYYLKDYSDFEEILDMCIRDDLLYLEDNHYYLASDYEDEKYIAEYLSLEKEHLDKDELNIEDGIKQCEFEYSIEFDDLQKKAIHTFFNEDFSLIVGGPGTGKTTIIKTLVSMFKEFYPYHNIIVCAPTGRAAKRINEICDVESKTIHSLLRWNKETNTFIHKIDNPILYDCLIIDEFSMVDTNLFASLLRACQYVKKICIIGDNQQLPSIRQGNVLKDLIDSNKFNITYLNTNHRQKEGSEIISLAANIIDGNLSFSDFKSDIQYIDIDNTRAIDLINMIKEDIDNGLSIDDIQVLSPMYKGEFGIDNLNSIMQKFFNPKSEHKKERTVGKITFREGDKILELKNRPSDDVYNGDIGVLEEIDEDNKCFIVNYQDLRVFYNFDDLNDISLAYALSVHKAQGSEYKTVYFIVSRAHINMLYKKLIYTAVTRARNKLVIIGNLDVFNSGIRRELGKRKTTLLDKIVNF